MHPKSSRLVRSLAPSHCLRATLHPRRWGHQPIGVINRSRLEEVPHRHYPGRPLRTHPIAGHWQSLVDSCLASVLCFAPLIYSPNPVDRQRRPQRARVQTGSAAGRPCPGLAKGSGRRPSRERGSAPGRRVRRRPQTSLSPPGVGVGPRCRASTGRPLANLDLDLDPGHRAAIPISR
jgi:hypothetical protein